MRVTQKQIAAIVGVDVSTVNKILNKFEGAVFHRDTIKHVHQVARRLGFNFRRLSKGAYHRQLVETRTALAALRDEVAVIPGHQARRSLVVAYKRANAVLAGTVAR